MIRTVRKRWVALYLLWVGVLIQAQDRSGYQNWRYLDGDDVTGNNTNTTDDDGGTRASGPLSEDDNNLITLIFIVGAMFFLWCSGRAYQRKVTDPSLHTNLGYTDEEAGGDSNGETRGGNRNQREEGTFADLGGISEPVYAFGDETVESQRERRHVSNPAY